jgi:hypothetical protein
MRLLELNDQQGEMLRAALSYMAANLDDVNQVLDEEFDENAVAKLMLRVLEACHYQESVDAKNILDNDR